jgi:hypothetical protein
MLTIRGEQIKVFEQNAKKSFESETVLHIAKFSPGQFAILGEETIRQIVSSGLERAEGYGFTNRGPARFYVELMFLLGSDFDTDPQYPWAAELLGGRVPSGQMNRADRLYQKTMQYIEAVAGQNFEFERDALNRVVGPVALPFAGKDAGDIAPFFKKIYPQKCQFLGDRILEEVVRLGVSVAEAYSRSSKASLLFTGLIFIFGHGCLTDRQFPWIANTLARGAPGEEDQKIERLYSKTRTYLEHGLIELERRV